MVNVHISINQRFNILFRIYEIDLSFVILVCYSPVNRTHVQIKSQKAWYLFLRVDINSMVRNNQEQLFGMYIILMKFHENVK